MLSCQMQISVTFPKEKGKVRVKLFTLPLAKYFLLAKGSVNVIGPLLPSSPLMIIPTCAEVPNPFHTPVWMLKK